MVLEVFSSRSGFAIGSLVGSKSCFAFLAGLGSPELISQEAHEFLGTSENIL